MFKSNLVIPAEVIRSIAASIDPKFEQLVLLSKNASGKAVFDDKGNLTIEYQIPADLLVSTISTIKSINEENFKKFSMKLASITGEDEEPTAKPEKPENKHGLITIVKEFDNGETLISVSKVSRWSNGNVTIDYTRSNYMSVNVHDIVELETELQLRAKVSGNIEWSYNDSDTAKLAAIDKYNELIADLEAKREARRAAAAEAAKEEVKARRSNSKKDYGETVE